MGSSSTRRCTRCARSNAKAGFPPLAIGRVIENAGRDGAWARLERGELGYAEFQGKLQCELDAAGLPLRVPEMMRAMAKALRVRPNMLAAIRSLRSAGFRVGALTNNWAGEGIDRFRALEPEFDAFVQSYLVGRRKPEPEIYALVCEALAISPSDAVFLDDIGANLKPRSRARHGNDQGERAGAGARGARGDARSRVAGAAQLRAEPVLDIMG